MVILHVFHRNFKEDEEEDEGEPPTTLPRFATGGKVTNFFA
jgi:hypothetical protein